MTQAEIFGESRAPMTSRARLRPSAFVLCLLAGAALGSLSSCVCDRTALIRPPAEAGRPYIRQAGREAGFAIWIVNGPYIRANIDAEFTNFGQPLAFPFIPAGELWIDEEHAPGEERFFVRHMIEEHGLMTRGADYGSALERAGKAEREERLATARAAEGTRLLEAGRKEELLRKVRKELWGEHSGDVRIWIVDGELVRGVFFIDFTEGGHDKVYDFIPSGEVWIDDDVAPEERRFILLHELHERGQMAGGLDYEAAHRNSSRLELKCRRGRASLDAELAAAVRRNRSNGPAPRARPDHLRGAAGDLISYSLGGSAPRRWRTK